MKRITAENFDEVYVDKVELSMIDKFVCDEMSRQVHRYIKGMSGSKAIMLKFEEQLAKLSVPEKEEAIARYIDLNRKTLDGLDWKIVLARAAANYCDTFSYLIQLINDKRKIVAYMQRIKSKYIRFHTVYEENNKFGIKDYKGDILVHALYDFLRTPYVYVDDLCMMPVMAQKNGKMGLILPDGKDTIIADFIYDDIYLRTEPPYFEAKKDNRSILIDRYGSIR
uniref:WG repeat-containing protein n=2 Tax=unclassified Prevotella TaxID=2638335 RepID=A0AB33IX14_9BACT